MIWLKKWAYSTTNAKKERNPILHRSTNTVYDNVSKILKKERIRERDAM